MSVKHARLDFDGYTISSATRNFTRAKDPTRVINVGASSLEEMPWPAITKAPVDVLAEGLALGLMTTPTIAELGMMAWT